MKKVRDFTKMTDKLNRVLRAAEATCGDSILHNAACGDKESKNKILDKPEDYFHKVAIAGHVSLLNAIIDQRPDLVNFPDAITGPTPLINAARGGWSTCLKYLSEKGSFLDSKDTDGRTALNYARQFKNLFGVKYLKKKIISRVYIKQKNLNFLLVLMKAIFS